MCGIFVYHGKVNNFIKEQFQKGKSRGPESTKDIIADNIYMGFHRLAINGLDNLSNQPFYINGIFLICNGEIYNHRQISPNSVSKSDCESIVHCYQRYGIEYTLNLLDGVFSFALYDMRKKILIIARDPYGVRPLYHASNNSCAFMCASSLKQINLLSSKVKQFQPGTFNIYTNDDNVLKLVQSKSYSSFGFSKMIFNNQFDIYGIIYQLLHAAVKKRVTSTERPIACLLSGGLDSSLVTAFVKQFTPGELETYSIGTAGSTDLVYARKVAEYLGTKHTEVILTEQEFFDAIPEVIQAIGSYDTTTVRASVPNYLLGKYISEHSDAKVIFNGDGSDELTGGYRYFQNCPNEVEFDRECKRLLNDIHYFDVLRSDRCISIHGLEPRTPFLDRSFVQTYLSILPEIRSHTFNNQPEKFLLRAAIEFVNPKLLPPDVLSRPKEAFSDGINIERSWYKVIQEKVQDFDLQTFYEHCNPQTNEMAYYRKIFDEYYPGCEKLVPYFWMPRWCPNTTDPSARTIN